jgi:hypothetical protein
MRARLAVLGAANVQRGDAAELNLAPFEVGDLAGAENQSRLPGALTIAAAQRVGGETVMIEQDNSVRRVRTARGRRRPAARSFGRHHRTAQHQLLFG